MCAQPPLSDSYWRNHSGTDLISCPTCPGCRLPRIPRSFDDLVNVINTNYADELGGAGGFDNGRSGVPRPHESALFYSATDDSAIGEMAHLLRANQKSTPWEDIVRLATDPEHLLSRRQPRPLQVVCPCCRKSRNFDFVFGAVVRMRKNAPSGRGSKYTEAPSIVDFEKRVVPQVVEALRSHETGALPHLEWECCNCEASKCFDRAREHNRTAELAAAANLGLQQRANTVHEAAVGLGAPLRIRQCDIPSVPCAAPDNFRCGHLKPAAGVLIVRRELAEPLITATKAQLADLMAAPSIKGLFSKEVAAIGGDDCTRSLAGGDTDLNMALLIMAPGKLIDRLLQLPPAERAESLLGATRDVDSGIEAIAVATLDGELPRADDVAAESTQFFQARRNNATKSGLAEIGKCETGRTGLIESWAALIGNPDINRYARMKRVAGGGAHTDHMLVVVDPNSRSSHCLFIYPSGPNGRAAPFLSHQAQLRDGKPSKSTKSGQQAAKKRRLNRSEESVAAGGLASSLREDQLENSEETLRLLNQQRLSYGQPRQIEVVAGRPFLDATLPENRDLQLQNGPNARHARAVAMCGLNALLFLAACGLAPSPTEDVSDWKRARQQPLLGHGVADTCEYTWYLCTLHETLDAAVAALACVGGFYENSYGAFVHKDSGGHMESYALSRTKEQEEWALAAGLSVAPTQVPQLFVELHAEPNRTVWTGFFQRLLHCAPDVPVAERPVGWKPSRSAGEVFALQARGSKACDGVKYRIWTESSAGGWTVAEHTRGP